MRLLFGSKPCRMCAPPLAFTFSHTCAACPFWNRRPPRLILAYVLGGGGGSCRSSPRRPVQRRCTKRRETLHYCCWESATLHDSAGARPQGTSGNQPETTRNTQALGSGPRVAPTPRGTREPRISSSNFTFFLHQKTQKITNYDNCAIL